MPKVTVMRLGPIADLAGMRLKRTVSIPGSFHAAPNDRSHRV